MLWRRKKREDNRLATSRSDPLVAGRNEGREKKRETSSLTRLQGEPEGRKGGRRRNAEHGGGRERPCWRGGGEGGEWGFTLALIKKNSALPRLRLMSSRHGGEGDRLITWGEGSEIPLLLFVKEGGGL